MDGLTRYLLRQLGVGMVLVTLGLTSVIWLTQSLRYVELIVNRGVSAGTFAYLTMLLLPNFMTIILPVALFSVVVFVYNKLHNDREIVVMRAAGVSQMALARPAVIIALAVVAAGYVLNLMLVPQSYRMFRELQWDIRYNYSHILLQEGAFNDISVNLTVYVRERSPDGQLMGILVHHRPDPKLPPVTYMAERGAMVVGPNGPRVVMFNGNRQEIDAETHNLSILYFDRNVFEIGDNKQQDIVRYREARERSFMELFNLEGDQSIEKKDYGRFAVEAHKRLTAPVSALGLVLVALARLISGGFTRQQQLHAILFAIGVFVTVQAATLGLENLAAKRLELIPLMYANVLLPVVVGLAFVIRGPRTSPKPPRRPGKEG